MKSDRSDGDVVASVLVGRTEVLADDVAIAEHRHAFVPGTTTPGTTLLHVFAEHAVRLRPGVARVHRADVAYDDLETRRGGVFLLFEADFFEFG